MPLPASRRRTAARTLSLTLATAAVLAPPLAAAQPTPPPRSPASVSYALVSGNALRVTPATGTPREIALGCAARALLEHGGTLYVGCGAEVLVFRLDDPLNPALAARREAGGDVDALFVQGARVWAQVTRIEANVVDAPSAGASAPAPLPATTATTVIPPVSLSGPAARAPAAPVASRLPRVTPATPPSTVTGSVVSARQGEVVINLGREDGVQPGDHVDLYTEGSIDLGAGERGLRVQRVAVGRVTVASEERARVALGLLERVPVGASARRTDDALTASLLAPPRLSEAFEIHAIARPFLAVGQLGFGVLGELGAVYHFGAPFLLRLSVAPLGVAVSGGASFSPRNTVAGALAGSTEFAYEHQLFAIGLGAGWTTFSRSGVPESGFAITQLARLGALDGLHLFVQNTLGLVSGRFEYVSTSGQIQIPLRQGVWLMLRGGGGLSGYVMGELGLRVLIRGNGDRDSVFLTPSAGGGAIIPAQCCGPVAGPMVGIGIEWRPGS